MLRIGFAEAIDDGVVGHDAWAVFEISPGVPILHGRQQLFGRFRHTLSRIIGLIVIGLIGLASRASIDHGGKGVHVGLGLGVAFFLEIVGLHGKDRRGAVKIPPPRKGVRDRVVRYAIGPNSRRVAVPFVVFKGFDHFFEYGECLLWSIASP